MIVEVEKVDFNNLKKGKKYQIKHDIISTGIFWEYKQLFKEPYASFFERDEDVMVKHSYPPHYEYYRILSLEELHAKKVKFNIFEKTYYDDLKKDEIYKFDTYDASFHFKFGAFAIFRQLIFYEMLLLIIIQIMIVMKFIIDMLVKKNIIRSSETNLMKMC